MPSKITQLPDDLIARIAAGEVIERPASVIKELVENSLDAGATEVRVTIEGAGRNLIQVWDNGEGMTLDDAKLAFRRHATSKIKSLDDLETIGTFGFRGEALPSIASVSRFKMITRVKEADCAWEIFAEGGTLQQEKPAAREMGTTLEVRDLFFNTPARFKFLKADSTETGQCLRTLEEISFSAPQVTFRAQRGGQDVFHFIGRTAPGVSGVRPRIADAWGARVEKDLINVEKNSPHFSLSGFVSKVGSHFPTTRHQVLYVNNRPIQSRRLARAILNGYMGSLPNGRYPAWVLFLTVDPKTVDVNVHPAKREVKLTHESEIFGFMLTAVKEALNQTDVTPSSRPLTPFAPSSRPVEGSRPGPVFAFSSASERKAAETLYAPENGGNRSTATLESPAVPYADLRFIGQIKKTFLVFESQTGLVVLDQHAAAERVLYERLLTDAQEKRAQSQILLTPFQWEVAPSLRSALESALPLFQSLGFDMEPFGGGSFLIKSHPSSLGSRFNLENLLDGLSDEIAQTQTSARSVEALKHKIAAMAACKGSIRAGDSVSPLEIQALLEGLARCSRPETCPHGRPTSQSTSFFDLERRFGRR